MMRVLTLSDDSSRLPSARVLLLPGAYQQPEQFVHAGFAAALSRRAAGMQVLVAAPELAHLTDRGWLTDLHDQVVAPARAHAAVPVWLGGVSLGAFMALRFAAQYPDTIDGLCLLAPYLGSRIIAADFAALGDTAQWNAALLDEDDDERRIWRYVARLGRTAGTPRVFLGYGRDDRFADTQQILASALAPAGATSVIDGGHDWPVWRRLWEQFLELYGSST